MKLDKLLKNRRKNDPDISQQLSPDEMRHLFTEFNNYNYLKPPPKIEVLPQAVLYKQILEKLWSEVKFVPNKEIKYDEFDYFEL